MEMTGLRARDDAKTAINQMVSHWYENRSSAIDSKFETLPMHTQLLINRLTIERI